MKFDKDNWRFFPHIITDSLWIIDKRDKGGDSAYPGNFLPQIPYQLMMRYTEPQDIVLDPFAGSGTTLDVAHEFGRNCVAFDLTPSRPDIIQLDAAGQGYTKYVKENVELVILHPPYSDIIVYSFKSGDLSNPDLSIEDFLCKFRRVILNCQEVMSPTAHLAIVIGDKYEQGHVVPLGFMCMNVAQELGLKLKATIVKNFGDTVAKRNLQNLWRFRALKNGFYVFKHEYIFIFEV